MQTNNGAMTGETMVKVGPASAAEHIRLAGSLTQTLRKCVREYVPDEAVRSQMVWMLGEVDSHVAAAVPPVFPISQEEPEKWDGLS